MELPTLRTRHTALPTHDPDAAEPRQHRPSPTLAGTDWITLPWINVDWRTVPFRKIAIRAVLLVASLLFVAVIAGGAYGLTRLHRIAKPHRKLHAALADVADGSNVVAPYFSPPGRGGESATVALDVHVWFRKGDELPEPTPENRDRLGIPLCRSWNGKFEWYARQLWDNSLRPSGEDGFVPNVTVSGKWEDIWHTTVLDGDLTATRRDVLPLKLPGAVVHSLVTNPLSRLVATFTALPSPLPQLSSSGTFKHTSSRPVSHYGSAEPWPLWSPPSSPPPAEQALYAFLAHSSAGLDLKIRQRDNGWTGCESDFSAYLLGRTWVTLANDFPIYKLDGFKNALDELRQNKIECAQSRWYRDTCRRTFAADGHFENLLEQDDASTGIITTKTWRYGPFITTRMGRDPAKDYIKLPAYSTLNGTAPTAAEAITIPWTITYSALSPAKLALVNAVSEGQESFEPMWSASEQARTHDYLELFNALIGHDFNPAAHPIARNVIVWLAMSLQYMAVPLVFHYWLTRRVSTGLPLAWWLAQTVSDLIYHIVHSLTNFEYYSAFLFITKILGFALLIVVQLRLLSGIEVKLVDWVPTAVRLRPRTGSELRSRQDESRFDWKLRAVLVVLVFVLLRVIPSPPAIIYGPNTFLDDPLIRTRHAGDQSQLALFWLRLLSSWASTVWLVTRISQIHLNHASRTFAGFHPLTSYLFFASLCLSHLTVIFSSFFGKAQSMAPFTAWDVVTLVVEGVLAWQARMLPVVPQREEANLG